MSQLRSSLKLILQSVIGGLAIAFIAVLLFPQLVAPEQRAERLDAGFAAAVAASSPAVVSIYTSLRSIPTASDVTNPAQGALGSGVIISESGYIVTNWHLIEGAGSLMMTPEPRAPCAGFVTSLAVGIERSDV